MFPRNRSQSFHRASWEILTSERRLNFSQAFNPVGRIDGRRLIGTNFIFSGMEHTLAQVAGMKAAGTYADYLKHETVRVIEPCMILGALSWWRRF